MLEIIIRNNIFITKEIWFADEPYDVDSCDSVIFRACKNKVDASNFVRTEFPTLVIDLKQDLDSIFNKFDKKSCQYQINRAKRDGVIIAQNKYYYAFEDMNKTFRMMKGLNQYSLKQLIGKSTLFSAYIEGRLAAGQLYLEDKDNIRWLLGASKRLENKNPLIGCANRALVWEAIKYAKGKGIKEFDFGGYHNGDNQELKRINFFKESFGGELVTHYVYKKNYTTFYNLVSVLAERLARL